MEQKWLEVLTDDDLEFLHQFILCSGSLKDLASQYGVSYPTIRIRADKIIEKNHRDIDEDIFEAYDNGDGTINYEVMYYDGGCSFNEAIEYALEDMK